MRRLTLIRHGLTEGNIRRWYYGALDLPLCEAGQAAVQEAGRRRPVSPVQRRTHPDERNAPHRADAAPDLRRGAATEIWPELREISFGIFEGKSYDELKGLAEYEAWLAGDWFRNVPPGGESFAQAEARILSALSRMRAQDEDLLAVVHGGTVLTIMQALFPGGGKVRLRLQPRPGGGYRIDLTAHCYEQIGLL